LAETLFGIFLLLLQKQKQSMYEVSQNIQDQIKVSAEKIFKKFSPERIYIFGSHALGQANRDSDLDLCIIVNLRNQRKIDLIRSIRREIYNSMELPLDILIYDEDEFNERAKHKNTFEFTISSQGKLING
jgi:predicted nucleotidyltransferase